MDDELIHHDEISGGQRWITSWEEERLNELEREPNMEELLLSERDLAAQKMWLHFQNSATALSQFYKDRSQGNSYWGPFQNAASAITLMYKESLESHRRAGELGLQTGCQRKTREVIAWAQKRRRHIRREELIAFLTGKVLPSHRIRTSPRMSSDKPSSRIPTPESLHSTHGAEHDLHTFREALEIHGLNGAMSNISVDYNRPHTPTKSRSRTSSDLNAFITEELHRHTDTRKRSSSSPDVVMDSPTHKRNRLS